MMSPSEPLTIEKVLSRRVKLPVCPAVFVRLMAALENQNSSNEELTSLLQSDPTLTMQVIKTSNSAFYGAARKIGSVSDAIMRLGYQEVMSIACALKAKDAFDLSSENWGGIKALLWQHSLKTAVVARGLARRMNPRAAEVFFTAGMLHDCGKLILLSYDVTYAVLSSDGVCHGKELVQRETARYSTDHTMLGSALLKHWCLPDILVKMVDGHHTNPPESDSLRNAKHILSVANEIAHAWQKTQRIAELKFECATLNGRFQAAGINKDVYEKSLLDFQRDFDRLKDI